MQIAKVLKDPLFVFKHASAAPNGPKKNQLMVSSFKTSVLRGSHSNLSELQKYYIMPEMKVEFFKCEGCSQRNGIFRPTKLRVMVEWKDYRYLEISFLFYFG